VSAGGYWGGTGAARAVLAATSVANLRTLGPYQQFAAGMISRVQGTASFEWDPASVAADNGTTIIKPTAVSGAGRWLLLAGSGTQGFQGSQGSAGVQGAQGLTGAQGAQGFQGNQGFQGANEQPIVGATTLTFSSTAGSVDVTAYTVPASPSGNVRFVVTHVLVRLDVAITGGGSVVVRAGTTTGGNDLLVDSASWTSGTAAGTTVGLSIADLGTAFLAANGYEAALAASATVKARATTTGTISGGSAKVYVYGYVLP
jgi:hypothetical protein